MKYGLINNSDKAAIEMALREVDAEFPSQVISILEIGIYAGETGNGMKEYLLSLDRDCFLTGIDNNADKEPIRFATAYNRLIGQEERAAKDEEFGYVPKKKRRKNSDGTYKKYYSSSRSSSGSGSQSSSNSKYDYYDSRGIKTTVTSKSNRSSKYD